MTDGPAYLVTGASGNLGRATVAALVAAGARVAAADRAGAAAGPGVTPLAPVDLADPEACRRMVSEAEAALGGLDGVAHTVGGFAMAPAAAGDAAFWAEMTRLNLMTTLAVFQAAIPALRGRGGALVAVSAGAALKAPAQLGAYAASKAGVLRLVEAFADELKAARVRVNAVLPGTMDTPQNRVAMPDADPALWARPEEVAAAIAFLIGPAASGVTGAALPVTGRS
jgi:NAD(P)-dependent dehydrogenase (short-subunit alcohol dehydrogenase family)